MECIARYDFTPGSSRELEIHKNDRLVVQFDKREGDYVFATRVTPPQLQGYVPYNYVAKVDSSGHIHRRKRRTEQSKNPAPVAMEAPPPAPHPAATAIPAFTDTSDLELHDLDGSAQANGRPAQELAPSAAVAELRSLQLQIRELEQKLREIRNHSDAQIVRLSALSEEVSHQQEGWLARIQEQVGRLTETCPN